MKSRTDWARRSDSPWLYSSEPRLSVWPTTSMALISWNFSSCPRKLVSACSLAAPSVASSKSNSASAPSVAVVTIGSFGAGAGSGVLPAPHERVERPRVAVRRHDPAKRTGPRGAADARREALPRRARPAAAQARRRRPTRGVDERRQVREATRAQIDPVRAPTGAHRAAVRHDRPPDREPGDGAPERGAVRPARARRSAHRADGAVERDLHSTRPARERGRHGVVFSPLPDRAPGLQSSDGPL